MRLVPDEPVEQPAVEAVRRPVRLGEVIGQQELVMRLGSHIRSGLLRKRPPGHVLLDGPSGYGKTTLARAVHGELVAAGVESRLHVVMPDSLPTVVSLARLLAGLRPWDVVFLDEVHSLNRSVQEALYTVMEDGVLVVAGEYGPEQVRVVPFTLVAATTHPAKVLAPMRNRFAFRAHLEPYAPDDLALLLLAHCEETGEKLEVEAAQVIGRASRFTPRKALELLGAVRMYSDDVTGDPDAVIDAETALQGLEYAGYDQYGLDSREQRVLDVMIGGWSDDDPVGFRGGPVGLGPLCSMLGMDTSELTREIEPYLIQAGLWMVRGKGRSATRAAYLVRGRRVPPMVNGWR